MRITPVAALALASLAGCAADPLTPATVRARLDADLATVLHASKAAADGGTANLPGAALLGYATTALGMPSSMTTVTFDPDAAIRWLVANVFTDQNYLGGGVYRVPAELACTTQTTDASGTVTTTIDPACVTRVAKAAVQLRTEDNNGLHVWLELGADHAEPVELVLRRDELALTIDLDHAEQALIALAEALGDVAPNVALAGQVTADLRVLGPAHAVASLSFDRPLVIAIADQRAPLDGPTATRLTSATADVASLELDGDSARLALHLGLGETTVHVPDGTDYRDTDLPGITADATFDGTTLALAHVSLGTRRTTVAKHDAQAIAIDLNPNDGRAFSAALTTDAMTGLETITVAPRVDLQVATDHAVLGDVAPMYDVTRVQLDGSLRGDANQLEVLAGSLALEATPAQYGFAATAGQCVTMAQVTDPSTFASYMQYAVGACR